MKKAIGARQTGKTTRLIKISAEEKIPILTMNKGTANLLKSKAKELNLDIPDPISVSQIKCRDSENDNNEIPKILVDDAEHILQALLRTYNVGSIEAITITTNDMSDELI